ncbi:hypothetical protein Tco_0818778 [Tanacetum coccineum]
MCTRNSYFPNNTNVTIPRRRNKGRAPNIVEPELRTIVEVAPMAERTMEELLRAPTEGYGEAIVLPEINADHFEIKTNLLQLFPYSHSKEPLKLGIKKEPLPEFDLDLGRKGKIQETFSEAWERFKELLRACPHHGFTELTQVDTVYNGLNENEQDSLNAAAGGNLLSKTTREALNIIENKSKVRYSRNRSNASRMNTTSSKTDERIDKLADQLSTLVEIVSKISFHPVGSLNEEYEEITDKEQTKFQGSTAQIPPPVIPISIPEPDVPKSFPKTISIPESDIPKSLPKPNIPYPSRSDDQKSCDKASNQMEKIFQIFQDSRVRIICEEYAPELLGFPNSSGGNPTPTSEPFTSEFILEEIEAYLKDDSISPEIDHADCDPEEDIGNEELEKFIGGNVRRSPTAGTKVHFDLSYDIVLIIQVFTMKMEILLEPTSNKLMVEHAEYDESNTYVLERFNTTAGNPVKKILLKLNLSDHRKLKEGGEGTCFQLSHKDP